MIKIRNLVKEFSGQKVLDGIDMDIEKGQVIALVGPSGAGKSTILRSLNYLEQADAGSIEIDGFTVDFTNISKEEILTLRRKLAMVFQQFNLFERKTALDNVKEGLKIVKRMDDASATALAKEELRKVGLSERENHYPRHLSGGQKQRVALARALAMQPDILLLDEPTSALDATVQKQVLELLVSLQRQYGIAYLLITHDLALVASLAHRVMVLNRGRVVESGEVEQVLRAPQHPYTRALLAASRLA